MPGTGVWIAAEGNGARQDTLAPGCAAGTEPTAPERRRPAGPEAPCPAHSRGAAFPGASAPSPACRQSPGRPEAAGSQGLFSRNSGCARERTGSVRAPQVSAFAALRGCPHRRVAVPGNEPWAN